MIRDNSLPTRAVWKSCNVIEDSHGWMTHTLGRINPISVATNSFAFGFAAASLLMILVFSEFV